MHYRTVTTLDVRINRMVVAHHFESWQSKVSLSCIACPQRISSCWWRFAVHLHMMLRLLTCLFAICKLHVSMPYLSRLAVNSCSSSHC